MTLDNQTNGALTQSLDLGEDGLTVVVKDCIDIAGTVSACGSNAFKDSPAATKNADVVDALLDSGCKIIGKANMHELAFGMTGVNAAFGTPINPHWPDRIPGGSSSGSAVAVASGMCDFAVGTDTGGSVRQPAICCGVLGFKPTYGKVSRSGCTPKVSSLDCVGVFARSPDLLIRGMESIDPDFRRHKLEKAPRVARIQCELDKSLGDFLIYALMESLPEAGYVQLPRMAAAFDAAMTVISKETAQAFGALLDTDAPLGQDIRARLTAATAISEEACREAEDVRRAFTNDVDQLFQEYDVLITPALPFIPPTLEEAKDPKTVLPLTSLLRPFNLSGHPAIVLPIPFGPEKLPAGLQLIGRKGEDAELCAAAEWLAKTLPILEEMEA